MAVARRWRSLCVVAKGEAVSGRSDTRRVLEISCEGFEEIAGMASGHILYATQLQAAQLHRATGCESGRTGRIERSEKFVIKAPGRKTRGHVAAERAGAETERAVVGTLDEALR